MATDGGKLKREGCEGGGGVGGGGDVTLHAII